MMLIPIGNGARLKAYGILLLLPFCDISWCRGRMAITTRVRTQTTIDRIRATPAHGVLNPRAGQTGELTHLEIDTIGAASLAITASLNMEQVLATVAERSVELIRASASLVYLLDRTTGLLHVAGGFGIPAAYEGLTVALGE